MHLNPDQIDRATGVVLVSAAGDALGAGYEFTYPPADLVPVMKGGGLGNFAPGEWTDDTDQAAAILLAAADGLDLRTPDAHDRIAQGFADWYALSPADIGIHTRTVLDRAGRAQRRTSTNDRPRSPRPIRPKRRQRFAHAHRSRGPRPPR